VFNPHRWRLTTYETDVVDGPVRLADREECPTGADCPGDPDAESYPVEVEDDVVVVYL